MPRAEQARPRPVKRLVILASTRKRAALIADRLGLPERDWIWPRSMVDLWDYHHVPMYADLSLSGHHLGDRLTEYVGERIRAEEGRAAVYQPSLPDEQ